MSDYITALVLAALPALGNFAGGVLAESVHISRRTLSLALHGAAGIVLGVVCVELMPRALQVNSPWISIAAFVAGGGFFVAMDQTIDLVRNRLGNAAGSAGPWGIFFGVAVDLFSDGVMIGTGSTISAGLGLLLALGQVPADIPEEFATIATFKRQGMSRWTRLLLTASFALPILLGATLGYWVVRGRPELVKLGLLAFTAGVLVLAAVEEMLSEAHRNEEDREEPRVAALILVGGFALFALLSTYFE